MRIGFISHTLPVDIESKAAGIYQRMGMFVEALKTLGKLDMLFFVKHDLEVSPSFVTEMEKRLCTYWGADISLSLCNMARPELSEGRWQEYARPALAIRRQAPYSYTTQPEQLAAVSRLLARKPDILFSHRLMSMVPVLLTRQKGPRIHFDLDDIEHVALARSIKQPPHWRGKPLQYLRLPVLRFWERQAVKTSYRTFVCSQKDRDYLSRVFRTRNVTVIPNAVNIPPELKERETDEMTMLFIGYLPYLPNAVAADFLIKRIWPMVFSALPKARLLIVGAEPECLSSYRDRPSGVEFLGFVADIEDLYRRVSLVVCPILSGGGTRIKILEAGAYGKPVVSTTVGAEGIDLENGKEIILRDDPQGFADACIDLLTDKAMSQNIGQAARSAVVAQYRKEDIVKQIRKHFESCMA